MEIEVPSSLQKYVKVEIDVIHEGKNFKNSWAYLFQLNDSKVLERKPSNDPQGTSLSILAYQNPGQFSNLQEYLQYRVCSAQEQYVNQGDDDKLCLMEKVKDDQACYKIMSKKLQSGLQDPQTLSHGLGLRKIVDYVLVLNNVPQRAFSLSTCQDQIQLLSDDIKDEYKVVQEQVVQGVEQYGSMFQNEEQSQIRYVTMPGLCIYKGVGGQRVKLLLKLYVPKEAVSAALGKGGFKEYNGFTLPYVCRQNAQLFIKKTGVSIRTHPFAPISIDTPTIIQNKLLFKENVFTVFGNVTLNRISGSGLSKHGKYIVQTELIQSNNFFCISDELQDSTPGKVVWKHLSSISSVHSGAAVFQEHILDVSKELGGFTSQEVTKAANKSDDDLEFCPATSPAELIFKIFEIRKGQILYIGFSSVQISPFPGVYSYTNAIIIPQMQRKETEKTLLGFGAFASVFHAGKRALLGFRTRNNQIFIHIDISIQHFIPSFDKQALNRKMNVLNQFAQMAPDQIIKQLQQPAQQEKQPKKQATIPQKKVLPSIRGLKYTLNLNKVNQLLNSPQNQPEITNISQKPTVHPSLPQLIQTQEPPKLKLDKQKIKKLQQQYKTKKKDQKD